jgi:hypothetical protein
MERPNPKVRVRLEYKVEYKNPIHVNAGEIVQAGRADHDYSGWIWCRAADSREGWIPIRVAFRKGTHRGRVTRLLGKRTGRAARR